MRKTSFVKKLVNNCTNIQDLENCKAEGNTALCLAAITGKVRIAEILLRKNHRLLWIRDRNHMLPIQLASSAGHIPMTEFLFQAPEDLHNFMPFQDIVKLFFFALNNNIYSVASKLLERYPKLVAEENNEGLTPLQMLAQFCNNVLHLAGKMAQPEERFGLSTKYVLMRNEEIWFQEVQKIVPPAMQAMINKDGLTPKELFYWSHKELHRESASEVKALSNTLIVVATLIITLGITIALTIPIKDVDSTTTPIFRKKTWYTIFFISVGFETCFCASSMLFYASAIFPSDLEIKDELIHLKEKKIIFGSVSLFLSGGFMLTTVISGATLIIGVLANWGPYFLFGLGSLVLLVHFTLDYALWHRILAQFLLYFYRVALEKLA